MYENIRNNQTTVTPNSDEDRNRTVPVITDINVTAIVDNDSVNSDNADKRKRKRNRYHEALKDDTVDSLKD